MRSGGKIPPSTANREIAMDGRTIEEFGIMVRLTAEVVRRTRGEIAATRVRAERSVLAVARSRAIMDAGAARSAAVEPDRV